MLNIICVEWEIALSSVNNSTPQNNSSLSCRRNIVCLLRFYLITLHSFFECRPHLNGCTKPTINTHFEAWMSQNAAHKISKHLVVNVGAQCFDYSAQSYKLATIVIYNSRILLNGPKRTLCAMLVGRLLPLQQQ